MYGQVKDCVEAYLSQQGRRDVRTDEVVYLDVTNRSIDGYCYLFFGKDEHVPLLVAKAARTAKGKAIFDIELDNLNKLQQIGMNAERPTTPAPLGRWEHEGTLITLQTALPGTLMKNVPGASLFSASAIESTLDQVLHWWRDLQLRFGTRNRRLDRELYDSAILAPLRLFRRRYLVNRSERDFLEARFERERPLSGIELPFMARHADFCAANMTMQEHGIGVFDWEFPLRPEMPLFDLFFFFASVRFPYTGYRRESSHFDSFVAVYWDDNYFNRAMRRRIGQVSDELGIPRVALADLFLLSLIEVANMKYEGLAQSHGMVEGPEEDDPVSDEAKKARWRSFSGPDKNVPFACIQDGVLENLRHLVRHGFPEF